MSNTDGRWTQDTAVPDMEIFVGASEFKDLGGVATLANAAAGLLTLNLAAAAAGNFFANVTAALKRTGVYGSPNYDQQQFGTAALQPGPSLVPGTSGPEAMYGMPPVPSAQLATLKGPTSGPPPKGTQVSSIDVIYSVGGAALSLAQCGLTETAFANNAVPVVNVRIPPGANGLPTANQVQPYRTNILVANPSFPVAPDTETLINVKLTAGAGGTCNFYGVVLKCAYNLN